MTTTLAADSQGLLNHAVRHARPLSKQGLQEHLFAKWFNGLVYNQIWEDPRVDAAALTLGPSSRILAIASAGCNALNYLVHGPEAVTVVDLNHHHLALTRLKIAAVRFLPDHPSLLRFFGRADDPSNVDDFDRFIRDRLDDTTRAYWCSSSGLGARRIEWFARGFYSRSRLGQLLGFIHRSLKAIGRDPKMLIKARTQEERAKVFDDVFAPLFDNRLLRWIANSPFSVFSLGIPPSQHERMRADASGDLLNEYRLRARRLICDWPLEDNPFAHQAIARCYNTAHSGGVPDYLQAQNYAVAKFRAEIIQTRLCSTIDALEEARAGAFNALIFLDSQDWMPPHTIERQWRAVARVVPTDGRIIFRTAAAASPIGRALPPSLMDQFEYHHTESVEYHRMDRSAIYGGFHLYTKR